jgi:phosphate-selective porin OprO/OprP
MTSWPAGRLALLVCGLAVLGSARHASAQPVQADPEEAPVRLDKNGRPTLTLPFGEVQLRGRIASTLQSPSFDRGSSTPESGWQTKRLQVEGTLFKRLEFEISREFGDADEPERDAFANLRLNRRFEVRAGQFKMPFGRDALTGGANLDFVSRSLVGRQLAPGRDLGVMAHGRLAGRAFTYQAGIFRGDGDNARTSQTRGGSRAVAGRFIVAPFAAASNRALAALQIGGAMVASGLDHQLGLRGRTVFNQTVFFDRIFVDGRRLRRGLEAAWAHGPVSLTWERMTVTDQRLGMGTDGAAMPNLQATGWYLAGSWTITGERKDGRVEPRRSLFDGGRGALELTARLERLAFGVPADAPALTDPLAVIPAGNTDRATTVGLAWYVNRFVKINGNAVFESVRDPQRSPAPEKDGRFPTAVVQFQIAL